MPFGTLQISPGETRHIAAEVMAVGAHMVKIEGGRPMLDTIEFLTERGIPVMGHVGLMPQSVSSLDPATGQLFWREAFTAGPSGAVATTVF